MKLKDNFITYTTGDQQIMVSASGDFHGMVRSNRTAAFIVDCLGQDLTREQLVDRVEQQFDAPRDVIARDVDRILAVLQSIGALDA